MTDDKPTAPQLDWDDSPTILNKQRLEQLSKFYSHIEKTVVKCNKKCNKKYNSLQIIKCLDLGCFSLETPVVGASIFLPVIIPFTVPILLSTAVVHLILKSIINRISKDLLIYSSNSSLANLTLEQLEEAIERASDDGILTEEEYNQVLRLYKRFFKLLK